MHLGRKTLGVTGAIGGFSLAMSGIGFANTTATEPEHAGFFWASDGSLSSEQLFLGAVVDRSLDKLAWASTAIGSATLISSAEVAAIRARIDAAETALHNAATALAAATSITQLDAVKSTTLTAALASAHTALSEVAMVFAAGRLSAKSARIGAANASVAEVPADVAAAEAAAGAAATAAAAGDTSAARADLVKAMSEIKAAVLAIRAAALASASTTAPTPKATALPTDFRLGGCDHHFGGTSYGRDGWDRYHYRYGGSRDGDYRWRG